jgi:hypothetical protein
MRGPTLALIIGIAVVVIATVIALQQISQTQTKTATPTQTPTPTSPSAGTAPTTGIEFDPQLAEKGRLYFTSVVIPLSRWASPAAATLQSALCCA